MLLGAVKVVEYQLYVSTTLLSLLARLQLSPSPSTCWRSQGSALRTAAMKRRIIHLLSHIPPVRPSAAIESATVERDMKLWEEEKWELREMMQILLYSQEDEREEEKGEDGVEDEDEVEESEEDFLERERQGRRRQRHLLDQLNSCATVEDYEWQKRN